MVASIALGAPECGFSISQGIVYNLISLCRVSAIMRGSDFAELKAFAAVVERASFARAAEHLGLSPSALSQIIRQLEGRLGVRLLDRTTRSVAPTPAGSRLHERIAPMILEMDAAIAEAVAATGHTAGTLRINTLGMAAKKIIAPRLRRVSPPKPDCVVRD